MCISIYNLFGVKLYSIFMVVCNSNPMFMISCKLLYHGSSTLLSVFENVLSN